VSAARLSAPGTRTGRLQRACLGVLLAHEQAGELPTSNRFIYYELKQAGYPLIRHAARRDDQDVIDAVKRLRDAGQVPWNWLSDETRSIEGAHLAGSVRQWVLDMLGRPGERLGWPAAPCGDHREPRRAGRPARTAGRYGALITSTNGQVGGFLHTDVAPLLAPGGPVAYLGDWNPAGSMIEANTRAVLERATAGPLGWARLAITPEQAAEAGLPPKPGTDRRYRDGRPHESWEAEALGHAALNEMLAAWLGGLLPGPIEDVQEREQAERDALRELLSREAR
jgi:hypothetical protein